MESMVIFITLLQMVTLYPRSYAAETTVRIATGTLVGAEHQSAEGRPFNAYMGIPYATPPTDRLRFKPPEAALPWEGILDATKDGQQCPQPNFLNPDKEIVGNEDCLFVNVYRPRVKLDQRLPVLVHIHGGAFYAGTGNMESLGPQKFMDEDIVFVTFNYRLGVLGFLSTEDDNAYGNYGLLDQVLALRWVRQNIVHFGGDPEKVTIYGISAGGGSVAFQVLSPLTKGLFRAAIAQSGSALNDWSIQEEPLLWAKKVAERVNCTTDDTRQLVQCLRGSRANDLVRAASSLQVSAFFPLFMLPVVEVPGGSGFLTENPMVLLKEGRIANKVPYITGITKDEGFLFSILNAKTFKTKGEEFFDKEFPTDILPFMVPVKPPKQLRLKKISKLIQEEYFPTEQDLTDESQFLERYTEILADIMFVVGIDVSQSLMTKAGMETYTYLYTYKTEMDSLTNIVFNTTDDNHVNHGAELQVQFDFGFEKSTVRTVGNDYNMGRILNRVLANFAATLKPSFAGAPVPDQSLEWQPFDIDKPNYMELRLNPEQKDGVISPRTKFWMDIIHNLANSELTFKNEL